MSQHFDELFTFTNTSCEEQIMSIPEKFSIVFDGCKGVYTHYVAISTNFPSDDKCGFSKVLF